MLLIVTSCSIKEYKPISESEKRKITEPYIFSNNFEKILYRTSINIYGKNISGISLIKKTDSSTRVVSMSELGIKYFDIEFPFNKQIPAIVHYIMEPMNKKLLINMIIRDFKLLLFPPEINQSDILINNDGTKMIEKFNKHYYYFNSYGNISQISKSLKSKPNIYLFGYNNGFPQTISLNHGNIWFEFNAIE